MATAVENGGAGRIEIMFVVSATALTPLLMIFAVPVGIVLTVVGIDCGTMLRWRSKRLS